MRKTLVVTITALSSLLLCSCTGNETYSANKVESHPEDKKIVIGQEASGRRLLIDGEYRAEGNGYEGPILVEMRVRDGFIDRIEVIDHQENVGVVEDAFDRLSRKVIKQQSADVDTISGATEASRGLLEAVRECIRQAGAQA